MVDSAAEKGDAPPSPAAQTESEATSSSEPGATACGTNSTPDAPSASGDGSGADDAPPGELAPAESDVPPPPRPASNRRAPAKTISLDDPHDALSSEAATEKRPAARRGESDDDIDGGWGSPSSKPGRPPRLRAPRARPPSSSSGPSSSSPGSLGLGARPMSKRAAEPPVDDDALADEPPTKEATRPAGLTASDATNTNLVAQEPGDADATAALPPQTSLPIGASGPAPPATPGPQPTARALHEEDEDDPTIVNYPQGSHDDEATAIHPSRGPFVAPIVSPPPSESAGPDVSPPTMEFPPGFGSGGEFASREAAVQAALAAATERSAADERQPLRDQQIVVAIATLLGVGMVLGALGAYLTARAVASGDASAGASLAGANVVCCISLFAAGFASLQPKPQARMGFSIASAVMLAIGFIWILAASFG